MRQYRIEYQGTWGLAFRIIPLRKLLILCNWLLISYIMLYCISCDVGLDYNHHHHQNVGGSVAWYFLFGNSVGGHLLHSNDSDLLHIKCCRLLFTECSLQVCPKITKCHRSPREFPSCSLTANEHYTSLRRRGARCRQRQSWSRPWYVAPQSG